MLPELHIGKLKLVRVRWSVAEVFGFILVALNISVSLILPKWGISYVNNDRPFGIDINQWIAVGLVALVVFFVYKSKILERYPLSAVMIIAGSFSNLIERLYFGSVKDYLDIWIAQINLADLEIWGGLLLLNYFMWSVWVDKSKTNTKTTNTYARFK